MTNPSVVANSSLETSLSSSSPRTIANFLVTQPTGDGLCQWLVTDWLKHLDAFSAIYMGVRRNGDLKMLGSFGVDEEVIASFQTRKIWERWPITDTARESKALFITSRAQLVELYPEMATYSEVGLNELSLITQPVVGNSITTGALAVSFNRVLTQSDWQESNLDLIAVMLSLRTTPQQNGDGTDGVYPANGQATKDEQVGAPLSDRQLLILNLMAEDKTNAVIAYTLGFSESTVRHESMRIYRKLGVSRRQEAIHVGRDRGLIK